MVETLSLVGAAFAVGGSYFAVDSLRDVLIAKTISPAYATRLLLGGAAVIGGLTLVTRGAGAGAKETAKEELIAQIQAAAESVDRFAAEPEDPNYMVKSDIHKITESGLRMTVLMDEYPEADLPIWWKSKLSVAASGTDELADNLGYVLANPEAFDAEDLTFHDWSDQEMMTHGRDDSFEDWVEHEIDSHGNLTLRDWADDEEESHLRRYGAEIYEAECASCDTFHGFDFICSECGVCLDCDPCTHDSKARGPFTDRDAEESVSVGTEFTCDCGAVCTVDADTEIAYGPGGYDLRCGRTDDCRGDEKVLDAEVFEAFSLSDRPVSVKFGPGTSGHAKMKAVFTDASGDTKTTQFGYRGMSDYTKNKDPARRDAYLARHGSKSQGENWKDPTTAGALSRWVLWEKTSLPEAKSAFKRRFDLRAEGTESGMSPEDLGYQTSPFLTEAGRRAIWVYEPDYSIEDDDQ